MSGICAQISQLWKVHFYLIDSWKSLSCSNFFFNFLQILLCFGNVDIFSLLFLNVINQKCLALIKFIKDSTNHSKQ